MVVADGHLRAAEMFSACLPERLVVPITTSGLLRGVVSSFLLVCGDTSPRVLGVH